MQETEVSTASRSEILQEGTVTEASSTEVRNIRERDISVASVQTSSTQVSNTGERDISVTLVQSSSTEVRYIREREISVTLVKSSSPEVLNIRETEISVSLVQASSTEVINISEREMGRTSVQASTSEVPNSSACEMESTSEEVANRTEHQISPPVDRHDSAIIGDFDIDKIIGSARLPDSDTKWPKHTFKWPKRKVERKRQPKWISSLVDSDTELEKLCSLGPTFAVAIDTEFYLADETTYLPEVIGIYDSTVADISLEPPVKMFSAKKAQYKNRYCASEQVVINYAQEIFELYEPWVYMKAVEYTVTRLSRCDRWKTRISILIMM